MTTITIEKAKQDLDQLIERARAGEEIVITDGSKPAVKLEAVVIVHVEESATVSSNYRGRGILKGKMECPPDSAFFDPLPEDELKLWWGEDT